MKKKYIIAYNVVETKEEAVYWTVNEKGEEDEQIEETAMKKGQFLFGGKKKGDHGEVVINF